jgi:glutathione peroxidase
LTDIYDVTISRLDGSDLDLAALRGDAILIVNVASACGLTPQYEALQRLHERYADRGLTVLGVPCNQFGEQEPGTPDEIAGFCSSSYSVTFPLTEKVDVNGVRRHPLYSKLTETADVDGYSGDVRWNFEKFLVSPEGDVLARFPPLVAPDSDEVVGAIEAGLPR